MTKLMVSYSDPKGSVQHQPSGAVLYAEASYFDGYHFAHIAAWLDHIRITRQYHKLLNLRAYP